MIDVKKAVKTSRDYIAGLYSGEEIIDISLEEVEASEDGKYWLVTLGFTKQMAQPLNPMEAMTGPKFVRVYKEIKVDAESGQVCSMKIRKM